MYSITFQERERINKNRYDNQGVGLLEVSSVDGDCADLDFDEGQPKKPKAKKVIEFFQLSKPKLNRSQSQESVQYGEEV